MQSSTEGISYSAARWSDRTRLQELCKETLSEHKERDPVTFDADPHLFVTPIITNRFYRFRVFPRRVVTEIIVARTAEGIAGYVVVDLPKNRLGQLRRGWQAVIQDIRVIPRYQRMGIARELVERATELCIGLGCSQISAVVWHGNAASQRLFENIFRERNRTYVFSNSNDESGV